MRHAQLGVSLKYLVGDLELFKFLGHFNCMLTKVADKKFIEIKKR